MTLETKMDNSGRLMLLMNGPKHVPTPDFLLKGEGRCKDYPTPDDFTEDNRRWHGYDARARAAAVCEECPFRMECLGWALDTWQTGVFGGEWLMSGVPQATKVRRTK